MKYFLDKPTHIKFSLTNICNYRCVMCFNPALKQKRGFISDALVEKILNECKEIGVHGISLAATGDPLIHKGFAGYLKRAKQLGFYASTTSNCSFLTKELSQVILDEGLDRFNISIYSTNPEEHKAYAEASNFEQVTENIRYFLELWKKSGSDTEVNMWFLPIPGVNTYEKYLEYWKPIADNVGLDLPVKPPVNFTGWIDTYGQPSKQRFQIERNRKGLWLVWNRISRCAHVRYYLFIHHNGDVVPCCNVPESDGSDGVLFGNVERESIMDIWTSERYLTFKRDLYRRKLDAYPACARCSEVRQVHRYGLLTEWLPTRARDWLSGEQEHAGPLVQISNPSGTTTPRSKL